MQHAYESTQYGQDAAGNYQRFFVPSIGRPVAEDLIAVARLEAGERVLDVACGTGVVTRLAAEGVGPSGTATGLDLNPGMLETARSSTPDGLRIQWKLGDAATMPVEDASYDVVFCQMGLQFMPNRAAAVREMHRALAPRGRVHANLPGPKPRLFAIMGDGIGRHLGQEGAAFLDQVFSLYDPAEVRELFEAAGFRKIEIQVQPKELVVPPPREFLWQYVHSTPLAGKATAADPQVRADLESEVCPRWEEFVEGGQMRFEVSVTTVSAER